MLKTRVITALVMAIIGLSALFLSPPALFALLAGILLLGIGGWEAGRLAGLESGAHSLIFACVLLTLGALLFFLFRPVWTATLLLGGALLWLGALFWLARPRSGAALRTLKLAVLGGILLSAWLAVITLQAGSPWLVVLLVIIIAAADIGAYFSGRAIGGPKLAPSISPGKTQSGAIGGLLAATLVAAAVVTVLPEAPFRPLAAALVGLVLAALSIGGDLLISLFKRQRGLKDSSALLPGHGGLLDRFDSLGAALPFFALAWIWLGQ